MGSWRFLSIIKVVGVKSYSKCELHLAPPGGDNGSTGHKGNQERTGVKQKITGIKGEIGS